MRRRFWTPKMVWVPKGDRAFVITESTVGQGLIFGQTAIGEIPLMDNLTHLWKMEEASGTRYDAVGSMDLTAYNSPQQSTGKIGNCVKFQEAGNTALYSANTMNPTAQDFHMLMWVKWHDTETTGTLTIFREWDEEGVQQRISLHYITSLTQYRWWWWGDWVNVVLARSIGDWVMVDMYYDISEARVAIAVNNGAYTLAVMNNPRPTGAEDPVLVFASQEVGSIFNDDIEMDAVHVWENYKLTQDDRDYMWNSGAGRELA